MKKFDEFEVGDTFHALCSISERELDDYLKFSKVRNILLEDEKNRTIPGRAILSRMEGEFTRLEQIYGNHIILLGTDGDTNWENRCTRFLRPLYTNQIMQLRFTVSQKEDTVGEYGRLAIDYEGADQDGKIIVLAKRNMYRIKKDPNPLSRRPF